MTVWTHSEVGHTQDAKREIKMLFPKSKLPFETPKPTSLMEKVLSLRDNPNAIILRILLQVQLLLLTQSLTLIKRTAVIVNLLWLS